MSLKGYRLWVMGKLDSNVQRPTTSSASSPSSAASMGRTAATNRGEGPHHKQQHRLDEDEAKSRVIGSRYRADQWASCKATRTPPYLVGGGGDLGVAVQHVPFESKALKLYHFILYVSSAMGQARSTCTAFPTTGVNRSGMSKRS